MNHDPRIGSRLARRFGAALPSARRESAVDASLQELRLEIDELEASRARVVAAADAGRRKIERDLHDGVQQHLVALAVKLQLARQRADSDPAEASASLEEIARDVREALESVRVLAQQIYPSLLVDRGLAEALAGAASAARIPTRLELNELARYSDDVEAAVYFCCLEALAAAAEHVRPGMQATVRVWEEQSMLRFEVADDVGSETRPAPTVLRDRIGALGGELTISSDPGQGTRVLGAIPLSR